MKARLPKEYSGGGTNNFQQLARQAQKMQEDMQKASDELETREYKSTSGGGAVEAVVTGNLEVKEINLQKEVVDPEDTEMLSDLIIASVNEALKQAKEEKEQIMSQISGGLNMPMI